jgi:hypothetical protein
MEKVGGGRQEGPQLKNKPTCHIRRDGGGGGGGEVGKRKQEALRSTFYGIMEDKMLRGKPPYKKNSLTKYEVIN